MFQQNELRNDSLQVGTALKVCSFVTSLKAFPANMFKSVNLVFCVFPAKGVLEWGEKKEEVLCSQDFSCIRWRGGRGMQGAVRVAGCGGGSTGARQGRKVPVYLNRDSISFSV